MTGDSIYLVSESGLVGMVSEPYEAEDLLQELLATYPNLLAGGQMNPASPRRWLLVRREIGVPGGEGEASRWSLHHFIDQDAVPTLVEVKRSDTRLRREVVGQMLTTRQRLEVLATREPQGRVRCPMRRRRSRSVSAARRLGGRR